MKSGQTAHTHGNGGRIGPNSVIQTMRALEENHDARALLGGTPSARWIDDRPTAMVDEREFRDLAAAICDALPSGETRAVFYRSGNLTADYVLANRLPRVAQSVIRVLRRGPGVAILLRAIGANAGTFGQSGSYSFSTAPKTRVRIANPVFRDRREIALAVCAYNRGAFEGLFRSLIDRRSHIVEESCQANGDALCIYRIEAESTE